jgi:hypothetical protein
MGESNIDRLTRIERLLEELNTQTIELHQLAVLTLAAPTKRVKQPVGKKRVLLPQRVSLVTNRPGRR